MSALPSTSELSFPGAADCEIPDLTQNVIRTLVLYALAEFQRGHVTTIDVVISDRAFAVSDDGRGHSLSRTLEGTPYLDYIYRHLDYPFSNTAHTPVQLQGLGISLINSLCSELSVHAKRPEGLLRLSFRSGRLHSRQLVTGFQTETGNTIAGTIHTALQLAVGSAEKLKCWLVCIVAANSALKGIYNGEPL